MLLRAVEKQTHLGLLFTRESLVHQMIEIARQRACFVQCALPKAEQLVNDNDGSLWQSGCLGPNLLLLLLHLKL